MIHSSKFFLVKLLHYTVATYVILLWFYYFCIGFVLFSGLVLYSYIWLLYVFHLALKLFFPLKSAKLSTSGYSKTIYFVEVLIVFLIGTVPSTVSAGLSKYRVVTFPPIHCGAYDDRTYIFYAIIVPILAAVCVSVILMLLILYKIHTVSFDNIFELFCSTHVHLLKLYLSMKNDPCSR